MTVSKPKPIVHEWVPQWISICLVIISGFGGLVWKIGGDYTALKLEAENQKAEIKSMRQDVSEILVDE
jgi:hypothetical protein